MHPCMGCTQCMCACSICLWNVKAKALSTAQDNTVHRLLDKDGMLTLGTDDRDVDWEAMWRTELARDDGDPANDGAWRCALLSWPQAQQAQQSFSHRCQVNLTYLGSQCLCSLDTGACKWASQVPITAVSCRAWSQAPRPLVTCSLMCRRQPSANAHNHTHTCTWNAHHLGAV